MDNKFNLTGIQYSTFNDNAQIEINQTINVPQVSTTIPSDVRQGSPNFVGRKQDLKGLHDALQREGKVSVCAVRGMGGVGKTELAVQYALSEEFQQQYVACYWFSLNQGNLATQILLKAAPYLAMPEKLQKLGTIEEQVKWCWQNWHPSAGNILVIIDDVKSLADIPQALMPISSRFKVMVTTRQRNLSSSFRELSLGVLSEGESLELLRKIIDKEGTSRIQNEIEIAKEICRYLGYLPLALELVANYLTDDEMLYLEEYLQQLRLQDESLGDDMVRGITAEKGVVTAFNLSLIEIQEGKNIIIHPLLREYFRYQSEQEGDNFIHGLQREIASSCLAIAKTIPYTPVIEDIARVKGTKKQNFSIYKHYKFVNSR